MIYMDHQFVISSVWYLYFRIFYCTNQVPANHNQFWYFCHGDDTHFLVLARTLIYIEFCCRPNSQCKLILNVLIFSNLKFFGKPIKICKSEKKGINMIFGTTWKLGPHIMLSYNWRMPIEPSLFVFFLLFFFFFLKHIRA